MYANICKKMAYCNNACDCVADGVHTALFTMFTSDGRMLTEKKTFIKLVISHVICKFDHVRDGRRPICFSVVQCAARCGILRHVAA